MRNLASLLVLLVSLVLVACEVGDGAGLDSEVVGSFEGVYCLTSVSVCDGPLVINISSNGDVTGSLTLQSVYGYVYTFSGTATAGQSWQIDMTGEMLSGSDSFPMRFKGSIDPSDGNLLSGVWFEGAADVAANANDSDILWYVCRDGATCASLN